MKAKFKVGQEINLGIDIFRVKRVNMPLRNSVISLGNNISYSGILNSGCQVMLSEERIIKAMVK